MYLETLCSKRFVSEKLELLILIGMLVPFGFLGITYRSSFYPHTGREITFDEGKKIS